MYTPVNPSQSFRFLSKDAEITYLPSGEYYTWLTGFVCPVILIIGFLESTGSHMYKVLSSDPLTNLSFFVPFNLLYFSSAFFYYSSGFSRISHFSSKYPVLKANSVLKQIVFTQWACPLKSLEILPSLFHTWKIQKRKLF